jgi:hypothetical protein
VSLDPLLIQEVVDLAVERRDCHGREGPGSQASRVEAPHTSLCRTGRSMMLACARGWLAAVAHRLGLDKQGPSLGRGRSYSAWQRVRLVRA